jgi:tetratricopeptide (TPR) repeat protein
LKFVLVGINYYLGQIYRLVGDWDNSLKHFNTGLLLSEEIGWKLFSDLITGGLGHHYIEQREYEQALRSFKVAFNSAKEREDYYTMKLRLFDIGLLYKVKGEFQSALETFQLFIESLEEIEESFQSVASYNIGLIYYNQGEYKLALELLQKVLASHIRNGQETSYLLLVLVTITLEMGDNDKAKEYLAQLEEASRIEEKNTDYQLAKALVLKNSSRMRDKARAQDIFESIANDEDNFLNVALFNLCDLLIFEYKGTEDTELLSEIKLLTQRLFDVGKKRNEPRNIIKALLLNSKLSLLDGNLDSAEMILDKAYEIASHSGLTNFKHQIEQEKSQIKDELEKWDSLLARNAPVRERIEQAALEEYMQKALRMIGSKKLQT